MGPLFVLAGVPALASPAPDGEIHLSCGPVTELRSFVDSIPVPASLTKGDKSGIWRLLLLLAEPQAGVAEDGRVVMRTSKANTTVGLAFSGTPGDSLRLAQQLDPSLGVVASGAGGGDVEPAVDPVVDPAVDAASPSLVVRVGAQSLSWELADGMLIVSTTGEHSIVDVTEAFRADLPSVGGCAVRIDDPPKTGRSDVQVEISSVDLFVPLNGGAPATARVTLPKDVPAVLSTTDAPIPQGHGARPNMVLTLSAALSGVLEASLPNDDPDIARAMRLLRANGGGSIAFFGNPRRGGAWAGVVQIESPKGKPYKAKRLSRMAANLPGVERHNKTGFVTNFEKTDVYVQFGSDGRVAFASNRSLAFDTLDPKSGPHWLTEDDLTRARTAPILLQTLDRSKLSLDVAVRPEGDHVDLVIDMKMPPEAREQMKTMLGPMVAMVMQIIAAAEKGEGGAKLPFP